MAHKPAPPSPQDRPEMSERRIWRVSRFRRSGRKPAIVAGVGPQSCSPPHSWEILARPALREKNS